MGVRAEIETNIARLEHPLGRSFIRSFDGNNLNVRPNAAVQRIRNNMLCDVDAIEIIDLDTKLSASKCSSVAASVTASAALGNATDCMIEERTQRLKLKAMQDVKNGSPGTKLISKKLFKEYQIMSRDLVRYNDNMEMVEMFNSSSSVRREKLDSIEAHDSFEQLEK